MSSTYSLRPKHFNWRYIVLAVALLADVFLWLSALSVFVDPMHHKVAAVAGLAFPAALLFAAGMFLLTLCLLPRRSWIPLVGILFALPAIRSYCPLNINSAPSADAIKLITYNVAGFGEIINDSTSSSPIADYLVEEQADIVCLQEAVAVSTETHNKVYARLQEEYAYTDTIHIQGNVLALLSRYKILDKHVITGHEFNGAVRFSVLLAPHDTLTVVNCHFESNRLNAEERENYREIVKEHETDGARHNALTLMRKIAVAAGERARQADTVANFVASLGERSVLLMGDFNDTPISYAHRRIASTRLCDAYATAGNGPGRTFNRDAMYVRIDHVFASPDWHVVSCKVDRRASWSDHYPVVTIVERQR